MSLLAACMTGEMAHDQGGGMGDHDEYITELAQKQSLLLENEEGAGYLHFPQRHYYCFCYYYEARTVVNVTETARNSDLMATTALFPVVRAVSNNSLIEKDTKNSRVFRMRTDDRPRGDNMMRIADLREEKILLLQSLI